MRPSAASRRAAVSVSEWVSGSGFAMDNDPISAFETIGLIAHHFESCEYYLSEIFHLLCESENQTPFRVLGLIVSSDLRLQMAEIALEECMPRKSAIKAEIKDIFQEFRACQTQRNRAIHSAHTPVIRRSKLSWHHRPLWHQTHRYKNGVLKPGLELSSSTLQATDEKALLLALRMKGLIIELDEFLGLRKARRLKKSAPAI